MGPKETYDSARDFHAKSNAQIYNGPRQKGIANICPHQTSWLHVFTKSLHSNYVIKKVSLCIGTSYFVRNPNATTKRIKEGMQNPRNEHWVVCDEHIPAGNRQNSNASEPRMETSKDIDVYFEWYCECQQQGELRQHHRHIHFSHLPSRSIDQVLPLTPKLEVQQKLLPRHKGWRTLLRHTRKPKMGTARHSRSQPGTTSRGRGQVVKDKDGVKRWLTHRRADGGKVERGPRGPSAMRKDKN